HETFDVLTMSTESQYLAWDNPEGLPIYRPIPNRGLILNGRTPNWLMMAAVRQLAPQTKWIAVYQPQLQSGVVVVSNDPTIPISAQISQTKFL
ncbi:MAG: hypothetical protein KC449_29335, partial [Anaerolineales bacterium]|nr:hypothetical protein [Anaerolineales bacterium]